MKKYVISFSFAIMLLISACKSENKNMTARQNMPAKEYPVRTLAPQSFTLYSEYPANIEGVLSIEIRPRIQGYIEEINVDEGASVKKGELLFKLNSEEYEQAVRSAEASLKVAEANLNTAQMEVDRQNPLVEKGIVSDFDLETAKLNVASQKASIAVAKANLINAKTNLSYCYIKSPANGIIGLINYKLGSLVSSANARPLTSLSDISEVRAYFALNEKDLLSLNREMQKNALANELDHFPEITLVLSDGTEYEHKGRIDAISGIINTTTGSVTMRASFPNPELLLKSGSSGIVKIPVHLDSVLVIPQKSTYEIQNKSFVYVVTGDQHVKATHIEVRPDGTGQNFVVTSGLKPGDTIVTEGTASLRDGSPIKPIQASKDSMASPK